MHDGKPDFWDPCWACRVLAGEPVGTIVSQSAGVAILVNPFPLTAGHVLVVPRRHIENVYALPDEIAGPVLSAASRAARAIKRTYAAEGVTLRQNNEPASDQHLFHFHLHVIPRFRGDSERFAASPVLASRAEQEAVAERLRAALAEDGAR